MEGPQLLGATSSAHVTYVRAGAGSGKTYLAREAFGYLRFVRYRNDPRGIGAVTFARSARRELDTRIRMRWGSGTTGRPNTISTFDEIHRQLVRFLTVAGYVEWPGGRLPDLVEDSWHQHSDATPSPAQKPRMALALDDEGIISVRTTTSDRAAPKPCFVDQPKFLAALGSGYCTHADIRNVLGNAIDPDRHPIYRAAIAESLRRAFCHLIVDEAFDMNGLDAGVVSLAIEAGVGVTMVGDPWQSLYEFRGASSEEVWSLLRRHKHRAIEMPGERRYQTSEMRELALQLFRGEQFQVREATADHSFDVVLAHDWNALWSTTLLPVLPAGKPTRLDRGPLSTAFVLLLDRVVFEIFGLQATGASEAARLLGVTETARHLRAAILALRSPTATADEVWSALRSSFEPEDATWARPGKIAKDAMVRLKVLCSSPTLPTLGLSVHQAKGLEWDRVLFLDGELTTDRSKANVLEENQESHRNVYVALTRARQFVRVSHVSQDPHAPKPRARISHVRFAGPRENV